MSSRALGIIYGLLACMLWGITFVVPRIVHEASPALIAIVRYFVFGGISLGFLISKRSKVLKTITTSHLKMSFFLAIMSNSLYYFLAVIGLRLVGVPFGSLVIGLIPITLVIFGGEGKIPRKIYESCALILIGLLCLNFQVFGVDAVSGNEQRMKFLGACLVFICLVMWTIYGIKNSKYLKLNPEIDGGIWTSLIGVMSLISLFVMLPLYIFIVGNPITEWNILASNIQLKVLFWSIISGFFASWVAYNLWNKASKIIPTSLLGQIVVVETLTAIAADHFLDRAWPTSITLLAVVFILSGTYWGVRNSSLRT